MTHKAFQTDWKIVRATAFGVFLDTTSESKVAKRWRQYFPYYEGQMVVSDLKLRGMKRDLLLEWRRSTSFSL